MSDLTSLIDDALDNAEVEGRTASLLKSVTTLNQIQSGSGVGVNEYPHPEVRLVTFLLDDSQSMYGNVGLMVNGFNDIINALKTGSKRQQQQTLVSCLFLNKGLLFPYTYLESVRPLQDRDVMADGMTPLYNQAVAVIGGVLLKAKDFDDNGISTRSWSMILSDGGNNVRGSSERDVAAIINKLNVEQHKVLGFGIDDGETDFKAVFQSMGIHPNNVLVASNDPSAIRRQFNAASQSAVALNTANTASGSGLLS